MYTPIGLAYDSVTSRLFVGDGANERVLVFNASTSVLVPNGSGNGANAVNVLGQTNFTSDNWTTTQSGMRTPGGLAYDPVAWRLFVGDTDNGRVMIFNASTSVLVPNGSGNGANAVNVLGEPNFTANDDEDPTKISQSIMAGPYAPSYDPATGRLFVDDVNRILVFNASTSALVPNGSGNGENASGLLGHIDPNGNPIWTDSESDNAPNFQGLNTNNSNRGIDIDIVNHRLFVADDGNNRILVFSLDSQNNIASTSASYVLGQPDFNSDVATTTRSGMWGPGGVAYDASTSRLFVSDLQNNRVLVFDVSTSTIHNGENAENVLGQADFVSADEALTQSGLSGPTGLTYDPMTSRLFVADSNNYRVLVFNASTSALVPNGSGNGENAENVLGQADFVSNVAATTQDGMDGPGGLTYDPSTKHLFVQDITNNRVTQFSLIQITLASLPTGTAGKPYNATVTVASAQGTPSFSIISGSLPSGLQFSTSTGNVSGTPISSGTFPLTIQVNDNTDVGFFMTTAAYTLIINSTSTPSISSFSATPSIVPLNGTSTLSWSTSGTNSLSINHGIGTVTGTNTITGALATTTIFTLSANNTNGTSTATTTVTVDATAPTTPTSPNATAVSLAQINLSWTVSTDSGGSGLSGYNIFRCTGICTPATQIATSSSTSYGDTGLAMNTTYTYSISAYDGVGNVSATSTSASATTQASSGVGITVSSGGGGGSAYYVRINGGVATTPTTSVTLSLYGTEAYTMEVSNTSTFAESSWQPYATSLPWVLNPATGTEMVYAQFRSVASTTLGSASAAIQYLPNSTSTPPKRPSPIILKAQAALLEQELQALLVGLSGSSGRGSSGGALSDTGPPTGIVAAYGFTRNLGLWDVGVDVRKLQQILITADVGSSAAALSRYGTTAVFGMLTYSALKEYQAKAGISPTGFFGPITRKYVEGSK